MAARNPFPFALILFGLLLAAGHAEAWDDPPLRIPDGRGMEFFHGYWGPTGAGETGELTIEPGRMVFERTYLPSPYKVLAETDRYVLLVIEWNHPKGYFRGMLDDTIYPFVKLSLIRAGSRPKMFHMLWRDCLSMKNGKERYGAEHFRLGPAELLALYQADPYCGPNSPQPSPRENAFRDIDSSMLFSPESWRSDGEGIPLQPDEKWRPEWSPE